MASLSEKEKEKQRLRDFRFLSELAQKRGISVRREKLSRGYSYRVKSGECVFGGENLVFVDRRLPIEQQLAILVDYLIDSNISLLAEDAQALSTPTRHAFEALQLVAA